MVNSTAMICTGQGQGQIISVSVLVAMCIKHANRILRKIGSKHLNPNFSADTILASSRQLIATIKSKAIPYIQKTRFGNKGETKVDDGVWRKNILMGEKCELPVFSGVIYYDAEGNQLPELPPRSPGGAQMQGLCSNCHHRRTLVTVSSNLSSPKDTSNDYF